MNSKRIRVLVVDDSAFARKVIREVLSRDSEIEVVGYARDGLEALEKINELHPDVVTLDLLMPELDGLGVLRALTRNIPPKVVIVSVSSSEAELAVQALEEGAVDIVSKPTALATDRMYDLSAELIFKVKAAAVATFPHQSLRIQRIQNRSETPGPTSRSAQTKLVVIGTSTGGPQALTQLFKALPGGLTAPIAIALHIPPGYTGPLAARLSQGSALKLVEASDGMELRPGNAVIAPGGTHLRILSVRGRLYTSVSREPKEVLHHPSVDMLFESAALAAGKGVLGIVLTGMGDDGTRGSKAIRQAGGRVFSEAASSCVVYGMPRSVVEAGLSNAEVPLEKIPKLIADQVLGAGGSVDTSILGASI